MARTPDGNAGTWRDLADLLTPEQRAELDYCERHDIPPGFTDERGLREARALIARNITQALCASVAAPPDAVGEPGPWEHWGDDRYARVYTAGPARQAAGYQVDIFGIQYDDEATERQVVITELADRAGMSAPAARELAEALIEAANEV